MFVQSLMYIFGIFLIAFNKRLLGCFMSDQKKNAQPPVDTALLILVLVLAVFGLIILLSASEYNGRVRFHDSAYYFKKQLFATSLGLGAMYIISTINYRFFVRLAPAAYLLSLLLSTTVLLVGQEINGSKRWLNLGPLSFQPSEFAKVSVILFLTWQIENSRRRTDGFWFMCRTMLTLLPIAGLVGSNNLSTAIIILGIGVILIFASSPRYMQFVALGSAGIGFIAVFLAAESYRLERLAIWRDPEIYMRDCTKIMMCYNFEYIKRRGTRKMKKFIEEFKTFALRGNVMDMAVGVIIGGAFSGIVTSLTDNFINPMIVSLSIPGSNLL